MSTASTTQPSGSEMPPFVNDAQMYVTVPTGPYLNVDALLFDFPLRTLVKPQYKHLRPDQIVAQHLDYNTFGRLLHIWLSTQEVPLPHWWHSIWWHRAVPEGSRCIFKQVEVKDQLSFEQMVNVLLRDAQVTLGEDRDAPSGILCIADLGIDETAAFKENSGFECDQDPRLQAGEELVLARG